MSDFLLQAIMQLLALVSPDNKEVFRKKRKSVTAFLNTKVSSKLAEEYIALFDDYYSISIERRRQRQKKNKKSTPDSVKILHLCSAINQDITHDQKIDLVIRVLEYMKSEDGTLTERDLSLFRMISGVFNLPEKEYKELFGFITTKIENLDRDNANLVFVEERRNRSKGSVSIQKEGFSGTLVFLFIENIHMFYVKYSGKTEYELNGQILENEIVSPFIQGSSIRNISIVPIYYSDILFELTRYKTNSKVVLQVSDVWYFFKNGKLGLKEISFNAHAGKIVGIMGMSGSGKTTLLNVLNGSLLPQEGSVNINGLNIHNKENSLDGLIGYVSQDDLLIEELTVHENLMFNAKFCFGSYSKDKINEIVNNVLASIGLLKIKDMKVGSPLNKKISGGQRKRLNIALELLREPAILFLDEPTSGLSSMDSENIMELLRELAFKGKLIVVVIHQPSSDIYKMLNQLLLLDSGGQLIYDGDPLDAITYFKGRAHKTDISESECTQCGNVNSEQLFNIVESHLVDEYGKRTANRRINTGEWVNYFKIFKTEDRYIDDSTSDIPRISFKIPGKLKQLLIFTHRDLLSKFSNKQYVVVNLFEAPVLAFILSYLVRFFNSFRENSSYTFIENNNLPVYIFISVIVAVFIGLSVSADEIIKDRKIRKREKFLSLSRNSYLLSKVLSLTLISGVQSLLFVIVGNSMLEIKDMYFEYWIVLFSTWVSANLMGLIISDSFKTVVTIYILIPFLVIPQIILSGIIVKYDKLNPQISSPVDIPLYGELILSRWAFEALAVKQFKDNKYEQKFYTINKYISQIEFKKNYWLPEVSNRVNELKNGIKSGIDSEKFIRYHNVIINEISKENQNEFHPKIVFNSLLVNDKTPLTIDYLNSISKYLSDTKDYYISMHNKMIVQRDAITRELIEDIGSSENYLEWKGRYFNSSLNKFIRRSDEKYRVIEYNNELFQKIDPIYMNPVKRNIKAHFFSPSKYIFGISISTFVINIIMIWFFTIVLYIMLYFSLLKKLLSIGSIKLKLKKKKSIIK